MIKGVLSLLFVKNKIKGIEEMPRKNKIIMSDEYQRQSEEKIRNLKRDPFEKIWLVILRF